MGRKGFAGKPVHAVHAQVPDLLEGPKQGPTGLRNRRVHLQGRQHKAVEVLGKSERARLNSGQHQRKGIPMTESPQCWLTSWGLREFRSGDQFARNHKEYWLGPTGYKI